MKRNHRFNLWSVLPMAVMALALAACGGSSSQGSGEVDITLKEFSIESSLTTFEVGVPYHFVITNEGTVAHSFNIMPPTQEDLTEDQAAEMALTRLGPEDLPVGATATLDYTFTEPAPAGQLEFACHLPGHYKGGMKLAITVQ